MLKPAEIVIYLLAAIGILGAVIAFIKTPKELRYGVPGPTEKDDGDYAPEYTKQERIKLVIKILALALPFYVISKYWFFPWLAEYAKNAQCHDYGSFTGRDVVLYGLFIGVPLSFALILFAIEGVHSIKSFRLGQFPLPGEKVLSPTRYVYGTKAKLKSMVLFGILLLFVGLSIRGYFWANEILAIPLSHKSACLDREPARSADRYRDD